MHRVFIKLKLKLNLRNMGVFAQQLNPLTGESGWKVEVDDYDYHIEVARAAFADMLHDTERNQKYRSALKAAIDKMHSRGKPANVLDIGTGTGLLSMMAVTCGADSVVACEYFSAMAKCAKDIVRENGFSDKIQIIPYRSTDIQIGADQIMKCKANILVTEVFDTELIGEGAIMSFTHAHECLLEKDCIVVPDCGTIYAQVVESPMLETWNKVDSILNSNGEVVIEAHPRMLNCTGTKCLNDIQLSQLSPKNFKVLTEPLPVLTFDWSGKTPIRKEFSTYKKALSLANGKAQWIFMWWDLNMDTEGKILLSCAPHWAHPDAPAGVDRPQDYIPWRDHWLQGVYNLPMSINLKADQEFYLVSVHNEYAIHFNVTIAEPVKEDYFDEMCNCIMHLNLSRTRIAQMNQNDRNVKFLRALENVVTSETVCLVLSDSSALGLASAKFGAKHVYILESRPMFKKTTMLFLEANKLKDKVTFLDCINQIKDIEDCKNINLVFGEPFFVSSMLPWENALMGYLKNKLAGVIKENVRTIPNYATVYAMPVEFKDLYKIRCPLVTCEGFKMDVFDNIIDQSSRKTDAIVEPQPLWEYPCRVLGDATKVLTFDFTKTKLSGQGYSGEILFKTAGMCNGVALWVDWDLDGNPENIVSTGPTIPVEVDKNVEWDMNTRQGVHLIQRPQEVHLNQKLAFEVSYKIDEGDIDFSFSIK